MPNFSIENEYKGKICGIDEVGRGPLAGPVVAACVYIPPKSRDLDFISHIQDSKKLSSSKVTYLAEQIKNHCAWAIAGVSPQTIDEMNILNAAMKAMKDAFDYLASYNFDVALIDGNKSPKGMTCITKTIIKGDSLSKSIAAASILAKDARDRIMSDLAREYPHYGWQTNVGYPTKEHLKGINTHGITPHHRKSFGPVRNFLNYGSTEPRFNIAV